jgi:hypothetical protein
MAFHEEFEMTVNNNMQKDDQPDLTPAVEGDDGADMKKGHFAATVQDEFHDKKDHPPRFSTLLGVAPKPAPPPAPPPSPPPPPPFIHEYYPPPREHNRGVYIAMPLFILFALIIFFESTLLFAYTIFGMYSNAPSGLFSWKSNTTTGCSCDNSYPAINIAPNFIMPGAAQPSENLLTATVTSGTTTTTPSPTTNAGLSGILNIVGGLGKASSASSAAAVVTITPTPPTVTSVQFLTADASGNIIDPTMKTLFSTTVVDAPKPTDTAVISSRDEGAWAAIVSGALEDAQDGLSASVTSLGSIVSATAAATSSGGS